MPLSARIVDGLRHQDKWWSRKWHPHTRRVLVNARTAMNYAVLAPIVERLQRDARVRVYLSSSETPASIETTFAEAQPPFSFVRPEMAALMRFDAYLAADFLWMPLPRGARRIQTFHGVAGKYRTIYDRPTQAVRGWDRLFFINKHRLQHFMESGVLPADSPAARLVGMPKVDCLVDGSLRRSDVLASLGVDPTKRTVLYAPTWSPYSSLPAMGEELVRRLCDAGYAVLVKLHDRSRDARQVNSGGSDWGKRLAPLLHSSGGILATGANSSRYLAAADVLISDHSSIAFEYLLLDRPVVRVDMPELIEKTDIEPTYVDMLRRASSTIRSAAEVVSAVDMAFSDPAWNSAERRSVAAEMFHLPGTATSRAMKELYDTIELAPMSQAD